ncbi:radial spoke head protein 3 homolog isoform X2 [Eupeodes corollae]|uniref:radial spoke head protein 3 homolog isoform X2 n=1 Tax=Eupeodes corollae TaxID=290404 RepID=UPI0024912729|nr:radial spoke head protein 3 homolog isoform X2 [Eupeodes corollae]
MSNAINELSTKNLTSSKSLPKSPNLPQESPKTSPQLALTNKYPSETSITTSPETATATKPTPSTTNVVIPIPSFTVLNNDTLAISGKPNAIVRPTRRIAPLAGPNESADHLTTPNNGEEVETFAKALNRKLKRLRNATGTHLKSSHSSTNGSFADSINKRPLFITTVPTGVFLPPAKETPVLPSKRVYAFSTHPRVYEYANSKGYKDKLDSTIKGPDKELLTTRLHGIRAFSHFLSGGLKKRETPPPSEPYKNVMFDRRVVRGSNFAPPPVEIDPCMKEAEFRRRQCLRQRCKQRNQRNVIGTPPPLDGRRHERVQTEKYLEELYDRPPEYDANTQTDLFLERPGTPPFIPEKVGIDAGTEIIDGDLFDFDQEVQPILETLVGHCVEQSILEVTHEEEVAELRKQQEEFLADREADLAELRRLEAEELRLEAEKERRLRQDSIAKELDDKMQKGVTAAKLLQGHIASLLPEVLANLEPATDEMRKAELEKKICPWLTKEVAEEIGQIIDSREILTAIIKEIIKQRAAIYANYTEDEPSLNHEVAQSLMEEEEWQEGDGRGVAAMESDVLVEDNDDNDKL